MKQPKYFWEVTPEVITEPEPTLTDLIQIARQKQKDEIYETLQTK